MPFTKVFPPGRRDEDVAALYIMKFPKLNIQHNTTMARLFEFYQDSFKFNSHIPRNHRYYEKKFNSQCNNTCACLKMCKLTRCSLSCKMYVDPTVTYTQNKTPVTGKSLSLLMLFYHFPSSLLSLVLSNA